MNTKKAAKLKKILLRRDFYKKSYETLSTPLIDTFGEFSLEDCEKYLIVNNVIDRQYSVWSHSPKRIEELTKIDQLETFGNLYAIDNINRRMLDESEDVTEEIDDLLSKAMAFKLRSKMSNVRKDLVDKQYESRKGYFQTPQLKRLEQSIYKVAGAMMDRFIDKYSQFEMSEDFIEYVSSLDRNVDEVNRAYNIMYNLQNPEDKKQFDRSFTKFINLLQSHADNYVEWKKSMVLDKVKEITPEAVAYSRSKARDIMNKVLSGENDFKEEQSYDIAKKIDSENSSRSEELDEIVFNYVTECMDNGTARELTHGILSKEFIDKHRRELMIKLANIFAGSDYSDKDTAAMMCELLNQEQFDEEQM